MKYLNNFNYYKPVIKEAIDTKIYESNFSFSPTNVLYTFCSLTQKTYPHGTEAEVLKWINHPLQQDEYDNYFIKIGESNTMFTSHLDSATNKQETVNLIKFVENDNLFITTDGNTILGADDKAGVTVMLYMIEHNIPGLYYFFVGEEIGGIGSINLAGSNHDNLNDIQRCISFDRRGYESVITHQMFESCCTDSFADALCEAFEENGLKLNKDNTGIFTDSANFMGVIDECTNISVGYFHEHTKREYQNITYLEKLCDVCTKIKWDNLPIKNKNLL
jgi:hypothetical protein